MANARELDQFLTKPEVARSCLEAARGALAGFLGERLRSAVWVEPSAGAGAFSSLLPQGSLALDLAPQAKGVETADFLSWSPPTLGGDGDPAGLVFVGNPPFGKNASLAVKFANRAASFQGTLAVAFIVPLTFEKASLIRRLDPKLREILTLPVPRGAFLFEGAERDVPCLFRTWILDASLAGARRARGASSHPDFSFVSKGEADFSFQRVGVKAGATRSEFSGRAAASHHFLRDETTDKSAREVLDSVDWAPIKRLTAGNPSISKEEIVTAYSRAKDQRLAGQTVDFYKL